MGCCESTPISTQPTKSNNPYLFPQQNPNPQSHLHLPPPPPPPAILEEESVKEVLSETPISKLPPPENFPKNVATKNDDELIPIHQPAHVIQQRVKIMEGKQAEGEKSVVSEISDVSELCSFSGSFSTTTLNDRDEGEVNQRMVPRSPAKTPRKRSYSGEIPRTNDRGRRSPARVPAPAPMNRNQVVRSRQGQSQGQGRTTTPQRRNVGPPNRIRRDSGEASSRRSRSPAQRGGTLPGGQSVGQKNLLTTKSVTGQSGSKSAEEDVVMVEKQNDDVVEEATDSLDNPLVSLECFIFL